VIARRRERGFLMMVVLVVVVVLVFLAIAMGYLLGNSTLASASHVGAMQALFLADSGLEYEQNRWAKNLEWYRTAVDPDPTTPVAQALGNGSFIASANLPATLVRTQLVAGGATLNVYSTSRFPGTGILQLGEDLASDGEFVRYSGIAGASFTGLTRAQAVGTTTSLASAHPRSSSVYPVTILRTTMAASCAPLVSIQVDAHGKFLGAGTLDIEGEEVGYSGSSTAGGLMTLTGITRCLGTVTAAGHAIGQPVTPIRESGDSGHFQVEISSTGTVGANVRYARRTIQR
jgi:hypothetical protein